MPLVTSFTNIIFEKRKKNKRISNKFVFMSFLGERKKMKFR